MANLANLFPSALPGRPDALSRRAALFGAVTISGALAGATARAARSSPASPSEADARLVAIAAELRAVWDRAYYLSEHHRPAEDHPEWDGLIARFDPLECEMTATPADTLAGVLAKARALQIPALRQCQNEVGESLADDLVRLSTRGLA